MDWILIRRAVKPEQRLFLLRAGSYVPQRYLMFFPEIGRYVSRTWAPENHLDWPVPFKKQILVLLLTFRRRGLWCPGYLLLRLFEAMAAVHFVFV